jgi:hypothetical protein
MRRTSFRAVKGPSAVTGPLLDSTARSPRYDMLALRYGATVHIATINIWLRTLATRSC